MGDLIVYEILNLSMEWLPEDSGGGEVVLVEYTDARVVEGCPAA